MISFARDGSLSLETFLRALGLASGTAIQQSKATILIDPCPEHIEAYNRDKGDERLKAKFIATRESDGTKIYAIRNLSDFPELINGRIESGSASVVILGPEGSGGRTPYVLVHKNPSKPFAASIGGTLQARELDDSEIVDWQARAKAAVREVAVETAGFAMVGGERIFTPGLDLSQRAPMPLYEVDYETTLFGVKVPDTNNIFGFVLGLDEKDSQYLALLFSPKNYHAENGSYKLEYAPPTYGDSCCEPSWICAVPMTAWTRYDNIEDDVLHMLKYRKNLFGASLAMWTAICAYITYANYNGKRTDAHAVMMLRPIYPANILGVRSIGV